ncbi:MAG: 3-deoxy-8-phosphooctulonate synthase [Rickettsiales bacterium]|nr:3-deoxy-8-phosphooctulonate synthase [Rickettsiales bacterium]
MKTVTVGDVSFANNKPFALIAGPCQMESREHAFDMCGQLKEMTTKLGIPFIYKTSFDKANRTSLKGKRGLGLEKAMEVFTDLKAEFGVPMLTDIHEREQCAAVAKVVDILQIPAFLCRQTDLLIAAAETGAVINIKKGQFLAPWDMPHVAAKVADSGNERILLTERGASFGYNTLVVDMRSLTIMANETQYPVIIDATHAVQQPGGQGGSSGGKREFAPVIARASIAVGVAGVFMETHQDPDNAPSDGPNMIKLHEMPAILEQLKALDAVVKQG